MSRFIVRTLATALTACLLFDFGSAQSDQLSPDLKTKIEQLAHLQQNFGQKMNSPGMSLSLKETGRLKEAGRTSVRYQLYAIGMPPDRIYTLSHIQMNGDVIPDVEGVTLDGMGRAVCAGREGTCQGNGPNDPIDLVVYASKGEAKRFALVSGGPDPIKGFVSVVPFPNAVTDKNCRLESVIGTQNGELTFIQGTGFEPNADLTTDSQSYDEKHHRAAKADAKGSYFAAVLPAVAGKSSGKTTWQVKSQSCAPKLTFEWGQGSYHLE